jgi:hypothetical protein
MQTSQPSPSIKRKRGRPLGAVDSKPRTRRKKGEAAAAPVVRKIRESDIQTTFMRWLEGVPAPGQPGRKLSDFAYSIPNGIWIPAPVKLKIMIIMTMRRQGLKKGVPDVCIDLPLHAWHGCRLEIKRDATSQIQPEQIEWLTRLRAAGFFCELCAGLGAATAAVGRYLRGEQPLPFPWEQEVADVHSAAG